MHHIKSGITENLGTIDTRKRESEKQQILRKQRADTFIQVANACVNEAKQMMNDLIDKVLPKDVEGKINPVYAQNDQLHGIGCSMLLKAIVDCQRNMLFKVELSPEKDYNTMRLSAILEANNAALKQWTPENYPLANGTPPIEKDAVAWVRTVVGEAGIEYLRLRTDGFK